MAHYPAKDLALLTQTWTLIQFGKRPYWHTDTIAYVDRITRKALIGRYSEAEITALLAYCRDQVAEELGLPPWDC